MEPSRSWLLARHTLPNESRIPLLDGYIDRRQGHWEKSIEEMKDALKLDPRNFSILQQISLTYEALHRYTEMAATSGRSVLALSPKDVPDGYGVPGLMFNGVPTPNRCTAIETVSWPTNQLPHLLSLTSGSTLSCVSVMPPPPSGRSLPCLRTAVTRKTFRFLTLGARVLSLDSAVMSWLLVPLLPAREKNLSRLCADHPDYAAGLVRPWCG